MTAEENFRLLQTIDENRRFLLLMLQSNPHLLAKADKRVRELFNAVPPAPTFDRLAR